MAPGAMSAMFKSASAVKAVITLVLIENSQEMYSAWRDLRNHYLPTLLGTMRIANPIVPIPVLWLTTTPAGEDSTSLQSAPPRQCNQLPDLKFSFHPDNRISSRIISRAIELMLEAKAPFQGPVSLHLIIVAASTPTKTAWRAPTTTPIESASEWQVLGQKLAQNGIYCHMVLRSSQDMHTLQELYITNLQLQGHESVAPWFTTTPDYTFYLSADPSNHNPPLVENEVIGFSSANTHQQGFSPPIRPPVHRHQSFPQDSRGASPESSATPQAASTPSLVSSLQRVHGLSRKKLYGAQPTRQPFVGEEPVRAKYRQAPTPLSIPVGPLPNPAEDGHTVSRSKPERTRRSEKLTHTGALSDTIPAGRRSPWNRSKMSSPEVGSLPSSPSSLFSQPGASRTMSLYQDHTGLPASPPATSTSFSSDTTSMTDTGYPITPSGADLSLGYFAVSSSQQPLLSALVPVSPQGSAWTCGPEPIDSAMRRRSYDLHDSVPVQSLSSIPAQYQMDSGMSSASLDQSRVACRNTIAKVKDAGDVPFIFSPELEAATAAKLKAALESTNSPLSTFTSMNNYTTDGACASYSPFSQQTNYTVHDTPLVPQMAGGGDGNPIPFFTGTTSSSSLRGWAG